MKERGKALEVAMTTHATTDTRKGDTMQTWEEGTTGTADQEIDEAILVWSPIRRA